MFVFHGFGEHAGRYRRFAHELNNHGFAVFSLDMQGSRHNPADGDEGDDDEGAYEEEAPPEGGLKGSRIPRAARAAGSRKLARPCHPPQYRHHQLTITVQ